METNLILIACALIFLVSVIYTQIDKSNQKELCRTYIENNKHIVFSSQLLGKKMQDIGADLPPCSKCNNRQMQVWDLTPNLCIIRCTDCNKKCDITSTVSKDELDYIIEIRDNFLLPFLAKVIETVKYDEWSRLRGFLHYDYLTQRSGSPYHRAIVFTVEGNIIELSQTIKDIRSRRISQSVKDKVWNRDNGSCVECGSKELLEFDHIIPHSKGGSNTYRNVQLLCENCNRSKSAKLG